MLSVERRRLVASEHVQLTVARVPDADLWSRDQHGRSRTKEKQESNKKQTNKQPITGERTTKKRNTGTKEESKQQSLETMSDCRQATW